MSRGRTSTKATARLEGECGRVGEGTRESVREAGREGGVSNGGRKAHGPQDVEKLIANSGEV